MLKLQGGSCVAFRARRDAAKSRLNFIMRLLMMVLCLASAASLDAEQKKAERKRQAAGGKQAGQIVVEENFFELLEVNDDDTDIPRIVNRLGTPVGDLNHTRQLLQNSSSMQRARAGGLQRARRLDIFEQMRQQQQMMQQAQIQHAQQMIRKARDAPNTFIGGWVLPLLLLIGCCSCCLKSCDPATHEQGEERLAAAIQNGPLGQWFREVSRQVRKRGWQLHDVTRVCVCMFFLHEGCSVFQLKAAQLEQSSHAVWTPFGAMRSLPSWEKGDACDMILLFTTVGTLFSLLSPDLGLILLLLDVATDTLDLLARLFLTWLGGGGIRLDELTAKKLSLLGVMALVATHRWRHERRALVEARIRERAAPANGAKDAPLSPASAHAAAPPPAIDTDADGSLALPPLVLLVGRLLTSVVFFYAAGGELMRVLLPSSLSDINPDDPHNIVWCAREMPFPLLLFVCTRATGLLATAPHCLAIKNRSLPCDSSRVFAGQSSSSLQSPFPSSSASELSTPLVPSQLHLQSRRSLAGRFG